MARAAVGARLYARRAAGAVGWAGKSEEEGAEPLRAALAAATEAKDFFSSEAGRREVERDRETGGAGAGGDVRSFLLVDIHTIVCRARRCVSRYYRAAQALQTASSE